MLMLTTLEYQSKYSLDHNPTMIDDLNQSRTIVEGFLLFNDETADRWAGPFEGNYAQFVVRDYTHAVIGYGKSKGQSYLGSMAKYEAERKRKIESGFHGNALYIVPNHIVSWENPIRLWMFGNDDTSYSKFYKTEEDAVSEMNLFIANEPLDFQIIRDFNFVFTN